MRNIPEERRSQYIACLLPILSTLLNETGYLASYVMMTSIINYGTCGRRIEVCLRARLWNFLEGLKKTDIMSEKVVAGPRIKSDT